MKHVHGHSMRSTKLAGAVRAALFGAAASTLLTFGSSAQAQTAPLESSPGTTNAVAEGQGEGIRTVTVTAQKRSDSQQNVPMSMSVLESGSMLKTGQASINDFFATVPSLSVNDRGSGRTTLVVRGVSAGEGLNPTVGVSIDDVPYGSSTMDYSISDLDPFDIDHIEVLRGPQGTLYGASSMGGLIKYVMVQPDLQEVSGRVQAGVSSTDHGGNGYVTRAAVNLPVIKDKLALRISAFKRRDPGFINDPGQQRKEVNEGDADGVRVSALWKLSEQFTVRASAMDQSHSTGSSARVDMLPNSYTPVFGQYQHKRLPGTDGSDTSTRLYTLELEGDLGWADFNSITSYNKYELIGPQDVSGTFGGAARSILGVANAGVAILNNAGVGKFAQELRLSSPDDGRQLSWLAGAFFTNEHASGFQGLRAVDPVSGVGLPSGNLYDADTPSQYKESALFGTVTYAFTPQFDVQVGGRYSKVRQEFSSNVSGPLAGGSSSTESGARNNKWTYSLSPRWRLNPNLMTYLRAATGYRAGGVNTLLPLDAGRFPSQYGSDSLKSYEWGVKGDFANRTVALDASLFHIDWSGIQLKTISPASSASYTINTSSAKSEGAEVTLKWRPIRNLNFTANTSYTHAVLTSPTPNGTYGNSGDRLPFSPSWSGTLAADYSFPLTETLTGEIGGGVSYVGDRLSNFTASAAARRFNLDSYTTANLHAGIRSSNWNFNLYVKNLTNARGYLSATPQNVTTGVSSYGLLVIQPRTVGASATYWF
ncbi:TonB-dependent receptor [Telluria beijingensis]|uniref:TonB-dependent receptor n=1 Tax=Telluria beijingensis TaxID=3068633 RepID=UPI00279617FA|nr:TonB-dependent receptor [Massilia sp. REN29]